jgi:hypothetical protein
LSSSGVGENTNSTSSVMSSENSLLERLFQRTDQFATSPSSSNVGRSDRSYSLDHTSLPFMSNLSFPSRKLTTHAMSFTEDRTTIWSTEFTTQQQLQPSRHLSLLNRSVSNIEENLECPNTPHESSDSSSSHVGISGIDNVSLASLTNASGSGDKLQRTPMCARCRNHNIETRVKGECSTIKLNRPTNICNNTMYLDSWTSKWKSCVLLLSITRFSLSRDLLLKLASISNLTCIYFGYRFFSFVYSFPGHKRVCRYRDCECDLCKLTVVRQEVMARQVKVRRAQDEDKKFNRQSDIAATLNIGPDTQDIIQKRSMR